MEIFLSGEAWIALLTLAFLEIVLGVDNIIFISIVTNKLPQHQQKRARNIGLSMALVFRIALLVSITWVIHHLTNPLFEVLGKAFSVREIILMLGGLFLLGKSTSEIHYKMEGGDGKDRAEAKPSLTKAIIQIILLDMVFSFDSILTAVGLTEEVLIMIIAVTIAIIIMMVFSGQISAFIHRNPTLEILALSFLILIGFMLVLEGVHIEVPKGYIYFAVFFSLLVEVLNMRIRKRKKLMPALQKTPKKHKKNKN